MKLVLDSARLRDELSGLELRDEEPSASTTSE